MKFEEQADAHLSDWAEYVQIDHSMVLESFQLSVLRNGGDGRW